MQVYLIPKLKLDSIMHYLCEKMVCKQNELEEHISIAACTQASAGALSILYDGRLLCTVLCHVINDS